LPISGYPLKKLKIPPGQKASERGKNACFEEEEK
jgi:hypothetical protein